ncbi:MAG: galactose mutarotase, partial [Lancefieldella sp.]
HGYDHCFCIDGYTPHGEPRLALLASGTKAELTILLTTPGAHFYTGNWLGDINAKDGAVYGPNDGFAFEPEFYPDFIHHPAWSQSCCDADHPYIESIVYRIRPREESMRT